MSRNDEIRAMAREICRTQSECTVCPHPSCRALKYAERAYDAGYRKRDSSEAVPDWVNKIFIEIEAAYDYFGNQFNGWKLFAEELACIKKKYLGEGGK